MEKSDLNPRLDWPALKLELEELTEQELTEESIDGWLRRWTELAYQLIEYATLVHLATMVDTRDTEAQERYRQYIDTIDPQAKELDQRLKQVLLDSGIVPEGMEVPLRRLRGEAELYREENLPLQAKLAKLGMEYNEICGNWSVEWDGQQLPIAALRRFVENNDRTVREKAWRMGADRMKQDRERLSAIWSEMLELRLQVARNAGFDSFTDYTWQSWGRHDYSPQDARTFQQAVLSVVTPALSRQLSRRSGSLGVGSLRPWDLTCDSEGRAPLQPFADATELEQRTGEVYGRLDERLGNWVSEMSRDRLFDLANRDGKAPGGFMTVLPQRWQPFIFMNAVGMSADVRVMLHECGHAFHVYQTGELPYMQQRDVPMEFSEVASMAMELLAAPYLTADNGGFYSAEDHARDHTSQLEYIIFTWVMIAIGDALQHWIYANPEEAKDAANVSAKYLELFKQYYPDVDTTGIEDEIAWNWQRVLHFFLYPFYYIDYGLAQLGAVQIWANSLEDEKQAVTQYLSGLALGGTATLPQLFETAGAHFGFDEATFGNAVGLIEGKLAEMAG
ncbi:MAG: M3 family oligoendopeptidase [Planctomycetales bacterium]|nr:M3 family oligoendopeptidase [bacterium]UNM09658.1 MAG: M3 family oligoendopeptidase [Planctomycetales bacterium]